MLTSTRLPSGGTIFASSRAVAGQDRRHLVGADVAGLGHVDDEVGHRERDDRQHQTISTTAMYSAAAHPLPVDLLRRSSAASAVAGPPGRPPPRRAVAVGRLRRRRAVECRLDGVDRVAQRRSVSSRHRRHDRGRPVVGRHAPAGPAVRAGTGRIAGAGAGGLVGRRAACLPSTQSGRPLTPCRVVSG